MKSNTKLMIQSAGLAALIAFSLPSLADQIQVPVGQQAGAENVGELPSNGMDKSRVSERFGEPQQKRDAVGDPPISSWDYGSYVVYFEGNKVLHSVRKHSPRQGATERTNDG